MSDVEQRGARATRSDHCRGCRKPTPHPFAGWATADARENTIRPRAYYRTCSACGLFVLVCGDVTDTEGIARAVLDEYLRPRGGAATATRTPDGPPPVDWEAALGYLFETAWRLYSERWDPAYGDGRITFRNFAVGTLRHRLIQWVEDETGEASERSKGRVHPKAHAPSVSVSYDELFGAAVDDGEDDHRGLETTLGGGARDLADDRSPDLAWALTARDS